MKPINRLAIKPAQLTGQSTYGHLASVYYNKIYPTHVKQSVTKKMSEDAILKAIGGTEEDRDTDLNGFLYNLIGKFKHGGYIEEKEWRFICISPKEIEFRISGNRLIPFVRLSLMNDENKFPISRITIGPGREQDLTFTTVRKLLEMEGLSNIELERSKIPYRHS